MNPFEHLGIEPGADEREIKRAYARKLKIRRPDEDLEAFQALREAYELCLEYARNSDSITLPTMRGATDLAIDLATNPPPAPDPEAVAALARAHNARSEWTSRATDHSWERRAFAEATALASSEREFNPHTFLKEFDQAAQRLPAKRLHEWLRERPELYAIDHQRAVASVLIAHLRRRDPAIYLEQLSITLCYFGFDIPDVYYDDMPQPYRGLYIMSRERGLDLRVFDPDDLPDWKPATRWEIIKVLSSFLLLSTVLVTMVWEICNRLGFK
ncbi:hypothetical protein [Lysobacter sp. Root690]|uniref:J domain-containing protein n=1 Tax=Lysobacter sp. Root690 TaxID=1736588 RepID=UPI0006FCED0A|nr:hypothetical protein [Lysobacter sp. Root690]KRB07116.1 hypothetical protein ASD86_14235 [Lysobacter sp. Root690]